jgi:rifampicin phosphotransferase
MTSSDLDPILHAQDCVESPLCGGKARGLARLGTLTAVPAFVAVPENWLSAAAGEPLDELARRWDGDHGDPDRHAVQAQRALSALQLPERMRTALHEALDQHLPGVDRFAVRSSAASEDGAGGSEAGLYDSLLDISREEVEHAVVACWRSWFSSRVLALRAYHGASSYPPRMAVIVQSMVAAERAGVAVTGGDAVQVEHVAGQASALVSGQAQPEHDVIALPVAHPQTPAEHAAEMAGRLRDVVGGEADVEWAWAEGLLQVLQARPVAGPAANAAAPVQRCAEPVLTTCPLYGPQEPAESLPLDEVGDLIAHYRRKRRRLYEVADRHGCGPGTALVLRYNTLGLEDTRWAELSDEVGDQVVIDVTPQQRQQIVASKDLADYLHALTTDDAHRLRSVVVRAFIDGDAALVSEVTGTGVRLDYTLDGLLALNRGWANTHEVHLDHDGHTDTAPETCPPAALRTIAEVTRAFADSQGPAVVEWVLADERPIPVDYSPLGEHTATASGSVLSPGTCRGPALVVNSAHGPDLETASEAPLVSVTEPVPAPTEDTVAALYRAAQECSHPPVLVVDRPYAILATLIGHVSGMVFRRGAARLCHLAILLREYGVPAAAIDSGAEITDGQTIEITPDGVVEIGGQL